MRTAIRVTAKAAVAVAAVTAAATPAFASASGPASGAVFVQTDNTAEAFHPSGVSPASAGLCVLAGNQGSTGDGEHRTA